MNFLTVTVTALIFLVQAQPSPETPKRSDCPMHQDEDAHAKMDARGEHAMGFSQTATTHHFLLSEDGGAIQVDANSAADKATIEEIRTHLARIAKRFAEGDFDIPMFVHDTVPPGVPEMKQLKSDIRYSFEPTDAGGRVVIATKKNRAVEAIHKFLRFQIEEHRTGDPE
jgi:hypothetical protein